MKTSKDPRHIDRIKAMQEIYAWDFNHDNLLENPKARETVENIEKINELIKEAAPAYPLNNMNKIELAVLRLGIYELIINPQAPAKVIIDEAVEIGKEFGSESSGSFINGALGKLVDNHSLGE